jgi:type IX secretion system PorP/SprF family membrane protein
MIISACMAYGQQSPQFTQFMFNNLAINPAYAGADEALSITALGRSQWTGVENAPSTQSLAAHTLAFKRVGLGLNIVNDRIGVHRNTNVMGSYAYHLRAGKRAFVSLGLEAGVTNFKSDYASLGVTNDPKAMGVIRGSRLNLGAGLYLRSNKLDLGISAPGFLARKVNINDTISVRFNSPDLLLYSRYRLKLNDRYVFQPALLFKYYPGLPASVDVNASFIYARVLTAGLSYRSKESIDVLMKLQLTTRLELGYAYDYPIGKVSGLSGASHEIMLHYVFRRNARQYASPR